MKSVERCGVFALLIFGAFLHVVAESSPQRQVNDFEIEDECFKYTSGRPEEESLECLKGDSSLLDLYLFAQVSCYKQHIAPLLKKGKPITEEEAKLLSFVLEVSSSTIDALSASLLDDLTFFRKTYWVTKAVARDHGAYCEYIKSYTTKTYPDHSIRPLIRKYASHFADVPQDVKFNVLMRLDMNQKTDDSRMELILDGKQPRTGFETLKFLAARLSNPISAIKDLDINLSKYEKGCVSIRGSKDIGEEWRNLRESTENYMRFYFSVYNDMKVYNAPNGSSAKRINGILVRTLARREKTRGIYTMAFYDMPFALLVFRASGEYRKEKGVINDSEAGMKYPLLVLNDSIRGTEMLTHVESNFALDVYVGLIKNIKGDMEGDDFRTLQAKLGLKEKAKRTNQYDKSTGLPINELE